MSLFSDNIRHLRNKKDVSRKIVADSLAITSDILAKYEQGRSQAPYETLIKFSRYFHVSIDLLLTVDIRKVDLDGLIRLDDNRILLPVAVDSKGENMIEIIPHKAKAGYLTGYSDPEFIENLQHITLPMLGVGKFRSFAIEGDSMPPFNEASYIVGRYVENLQEMEAGRSYVVMTTEGMTYKRLKEIGEGFLVLASDNAFYEPFEVHLSEVLQLWEFAGYFGTKEFDLGDIGSQSLEDIVRAIQKDVVEVKGMLHKKQ